MLVKSKQKLYLSAACWVFIMLQQRCDFCLIPDVECGQIHFDFDHFLSKNLESADISDGYLITRCVLFVCYFNGGDDKLLFKNSILNSVVVTACTLSPRFSKLE